MNIIYHNHHILPKHAGGTNDPSNLIRLSIEDHAEAHRLLYEEYGRWQDRVAWLALSGQIGKDEIMLEVYSANAKMLSATTVKPEVRAKQWETRRKNGNASPPNKGKKMKDIDPNFASKKYGRSKGSEPWNKGKTGSPNYFPNLSNTIWVNDGSINKRIPGTSEIPEGFTKGRTKKQCL
jgi:hypothetical protein